MTYSNNLQRKFVAGRFTPIVLLCASLCMWVGALFITTAPVTGAALFGYEWLSVVAVLLCFVAAAALLGSFTLFERRVRWLPALFLWLASLSLFLHGHVAIAFSVLLMVVIVAQLFRCQVAGNQERMLYALFLAVGTATLLSPAFLLLSPLFVVASSAGSRLGAKKLLAMLLGFVTPFWLLFGTTYVFPSLDFLIESFLMTVKELFVVDFFSFSLFRVVMLLVELSVLLPSVAIFVGSSLPGKPLLRRRLVFIYSFYVYLLLLSFVFDGYELFYALRLPWLAIMASYLFVFKINRLSNIYFIILNIAWLAIAPICVWLI